MTFSFEVAGNKEPEVSATKYFPSKVTYPIYIHFTLLMFSFMMTQKIKQPQSELKGKDRDN